MSKQIVADRYTIINADTVDVARALPSESVHFSVFSLPFSSLFTYSDSLRDFSNTRNDAEFFEQYRYLTNETIRVMKPGRLVAVHCMQLPTSKERDGFIGLRDFRGDIIREYERAGFIYHSEVCIWKCPVVAVTRTKALGLLNKQKNKDSAMSRQGIADYLVVMRKPGTNPEPIAHTDETFPIPMWQRYASPVWATSEGLDDEGFHRLSARPNAHDDSSGIDQSDTLQAKSAREHDDERHLCPLQLGVIRRAIRLWSNPSDIVWSPFAGIGSEGYVAVQEGRRFVGAELKSSYYAQAVRNLEAAVQMQHGGLFGALT